MEEQLFSWDEFDNIDYGVYQFYTCVLKVPIGNHKVGDTIPVIEVDFSDGVIKLFNEDTDGFLDMTETYQLTLSVGARLLGDDDDEIFRS